jgi:hypothetical protein
LRIALIAGLLLLAAPLRADQQAAPAGGDTQSDADLAKQTQNPVADLISVPFQNNFNFNTGPENRTVWVLDVQPVIPINLTDRWNLITRIIMPIINQPSLAPGIDSASGLGDINPTFFLSPVGRRSSSGASGRPSRFRRRPTGFSAPASTAPGRRGSRSRCRDRGSWARW